MSNVINSKAYQVTNSKELDRIFYDTMMEAPTEYDKIFTSKTAGPGSYDSQGELSGLGIAQGIEEGAGVVFDAPEEGNIRRRDYYYSGLGYTITQKALDDDLTGQLKKLPADLAKSLRVYTDIQAFQYFNEMEDNSLSKDNAAFCGSAGHELLRDVLGVGTFYNTPTAAGDLSETTFAEMLAYWDNMVDENSYPAIAELGTLLVSKSDKYVAHRLMTQMFGGSQAAAGLGATLNTSGVQENAHMLNLGNPQNGFTGAYSIFDSRFLDDDRWFGLGKNHDLSIYWKDKPKQTSNIDFRTDNTEYKAKQRFGIWGDDYKEVYGNITGVSHS